MLADVCLASSSAMRLTVSCAQRDLQADAPWKATRHFKRNATYSIMRLMRLTKECTLHSDMYHQAQRDLQLPALWATKQKDAC